MYSVILEVVPNGISVNKDIWRTVRRRRCNWVSITAIVTTTTRAIVDGGHGDRLLLNANDK